MIDPSARIEARAQYRGINRSVLHDRQHVIIDYCRWWHVNLPTRPRSERSFIRLLRGSPPQSLGYRGGATTLVVGAGAIFAKMSP